MISKILFVLIIAHIGLINAISFCCNGPNQLGPRQNCSDGIKMKKLNCEDSYILRVSDPTIKFSHDYKGNLILDDKDVIPVGEYCRTMLMSKKTEVYIVCATDVDDDVDTTARTVTTIFELISIFFILLTVVIYLLVLDSLHIQDACILHSITALAIAYLTLCIINLSEHLEEAPCHFLAYLLYFSFLYCFFWLNVLCFHIWKEVVKPKWLANVKNWKLLYHIYGIGAPVLAVCWLLIMHYGHPAGLSTIHPGIGISRCWFKTARESNIYFNGPVAVLLIINIVFFIWTIVELWKSSKNCPKTKILKFRVKMYVKLFFVMGITWIFEIISTIFENDAPKWLWIITDVLNAMQGLVIFLILVVFRKTIKRAFANRRIGNWRLPAQWKNDKDSECEELDEDISLSNCVTNKPTIY
ncbi:G-protein coupled receptor Mth2-like [Diabrotica undecimpunctata]|uniref:G-protein coupled receptor Mth2-like n=1 Tax=Diabrotica undecimpunctata TaxID=50387 RepID=UPI003B634998